MRRGQWVSYQSTIDVEYPPGNQGFQWDGADEMMFYIDRAEFPKIEFVCQYADGTQIRDEMLPKEQAA